MKFILNKDKLTIDDKESLNSGSFRYYEIPVETDETWDGLNVEAVILKENADKGIGTAVINGKVYIDRTNNGKYFIGFKGYTVEYSLTEDVEIDTSKTYYTRSGEEGSYVYTKVDDPVIGSIGTYYEATKTYQVSTKLTSVTFKKGAGEVELENESEIPSISEWEVYVEQIQDMVNGLNDRIDNLKYSDLENDNYTVQDASYVHTDNNFTNTYKGNVDSNTSARHTHSNKSVLDGISSSDISNWNNKSDFSGSYNDLTNKPTIPDELRDLSDDSTHRLVTDTEKSTWSAKGSYSKPSGGIPKTDLESSVQTSLSKADSAVQDISGKQDKIDSSHKLSADLITDGSTNKTVTATEKSTWSGKQEALVSGTNIKTINNESILGSGNITIQGGGDSTDVQINGTSIVDDNVANIVTKTAYNASTNKIATESDLPDISGKQDTLVSGTNIKTINSTSLLGSGDISLILKTIVPKNAGAHNSIYRGEDITDLFYNGTLTNQIAAGTFDDIFIGDYIIGNVSGIKYVVAHIDYYMNRGNPQTTTHHVVMVPEKIMGKEKMNDSATTTGAYIGSKMHTTYLTSYRTTITNDFGAGHLLTHKTMTADEVTDGYETGINWYDFTIELMNEIQVYGCSIRHNELYDGSMSSGATYAKCKTATSDTSQLALFRARQDLINTTDSEGNSATVWLRDVCDSTQFCTLSSNNHANASTASNSRGVRPSFLIY